jgi:hypothetical protein
MGKMDEDEEGKMSGKMVRLFGRRWGPAMSRPTAADASAREDSPHPSSSFHAWALGNGHVGSQKGWERQETSYTYVDFTVKNWGPGEILAFFPVKFCIFRHFY